MKGRGGGGGGFGGGMQNLMRQANQLQNKMKKKQEELAEAEYEGTAGGGAVNIKINGDYKVLAMNIDEDVFKEGDAEMLTEMLISAMNDAVGTAKETSAKEMEKLTGGMNIPGLF